MSRSSPGIPILLLQTVHHAPERRAVDPEVLGQLREAPAVFKAEFNQLALIHLLPRPLNLVLVDN